MIHAPPTRHPFTAVKVALLSGLSDPTTCALSPTQTAFLAAVDAPEACKVYRNFPYVPGPAEAYRPSPLWLASLRNARQFLGASGRAYRDAARQHWHALAASADRLVIVTVSCGLEILNVCVGPGARVRVVALGPVARRRPAVPCTLVRGGHDHLSRLFFRSADRVLPGVGHMDYLRHPAVLDLVHEALWDSTSP